MAWLAWVIDWWLGSQTALTFLCHLQHTSQIVRKLYFSVHRWPGFSACGICWQWWQYYCLARPIGERLLASGGKTVIQLVPIPYLVVNTQLPIYLYKSPLEKPSWSPIPILSQGWKPKIRSIHARLITTPSSHPWTDTKLIYTGKEVKLWVQFT